MPSSGMRRRVALVRTDFSEERIASIIRMKRISELGTNCKLLLTLFLARRFLLPDDGGDTFLRKVSTYRSQMATHRNDTNLEGTAIPVTRRAMLGIQHFLGHQLRDGGEVLSLMHRPRSTLGNVYFCL
jgi:hypothetical protein